MLEIKLRTEEEIIQNWHGETAPLVSICCIAFNHEEYIEDALKGFLMQETDFPFEILIHDDASLDNTANIIRSYQKRYPKIIKAILQTENHYSMGRSINLDFNFLRAKGKYIAMCEGDDYWIDSKKLAKQTNFLEENSGFIATYHNVSVIDENDTFIEGIRGLYKEFTDHTFTIRDAEKNKLPSQTASLVYRNIWVNADSKLIEAYRDCKTNGDRKIALLLALKSNIYCMSDTMAVYRRVTTKGTSWSASNHGKNLTLHHYNSILELNKFAFNNFGIKLNNKIERLNIVYSSLSLLIRKPTRGNVIIFKKVLSLNQDSSIEVILHTIEKFIQWPFRKLKMYLEK